MRRYRSTLAYFILMASCFKELEPRLGTQSQNVFITFQVLAFLYFNSHCHTRNVMYVTHSLLPIK